MSWKDLCVYIYTLFFPLTNEDYNNTTPCLSHKELLLDFLLKLRKYLHFDRSCRIGVTGLIKTSSGIWLNNSYF